MHAGGQAGCEGSALQFRSPVLRIGTRHHQVEFQVVRRQLHKCVYQQVAPFFPVDPSQEQEKPPVSCRRTRREKCLTLQLRIALRRNRPERRHARCPPVQPEAVRGQLGLRGAGKQHAIRAAQHPVLHRKPVQPLLPMLCRERMLEVRIEHSMGQHNIRNAPAHRSPDRVAAVLPHPVHHHSVEACAVRLQPRNQLAGAAVNGVRRPQRMHRERDLAEEGRVRIVQRHHLLRIAFRSVLQQQANHLGNAAGGWIECRNDVQQAHLSFAKNLNPYLRNPGTTEASACRSPCTSSSKPQLRIRSPARCPIRSAAPGVSSTRRSASVSASTSPTG